MEVAVFVGTSLDGFLARADGGLDWLPQDPREDHGFAAFLAGMDTVVLGRRTLETLLGFGAWPLSGKRVVALSSRGDPGGRPPGVQWEVMAGPPRTILARLAGAGAGRIYLDGGATIRSFLAEDLVDRLILTRVPVLLGAGVPLFGALPGDLRLVHVATRSYPDGLVQSEYRRAGAGPG